MRVVIEDLARNRLDLPARDFIFVGQAVNDRVEQAVAFLALLELRRSGEVALEQAAPFAPIRVSRAAVSNEEGRQEWIARSA